MAEAATYDCEDIVKGLYRSILGREADPEGLETFCDALKSGCGVEHVASLLMHSDEFRDRIPMLTNMLT